jgi:hypothetical protein
VWFIGFGQTNRYRCIKHWFLVGYGSDHQLETRAWTGGVFDCMLPTAYFMCYMNLACFLDSAFSFFHVFSTFRFFFCNHSLRVCVSLWLEACDRGDSPTLTVVGCHWVRPSESRLQPELEGWDWGDSLTLTVVGCQWVRLSESRLQPELEARDRGDFPTLTVVGRQWGPVSLDFNQNWKPGTEEIPLLSQWLGAIEAQWVNWKAGTGEISLLSQWLGASEAQWV